MVEKPQTREISFANVGRKKNHRVSLFKVGERDFDLTAERPAQSYAAETINDYHKQCAALLQSKGLDLDSGLYVVEAGKVVPFRDDTHRHISAMPLHFAIKERDRPKGQTEDYLAAMVLHHVNLATQARWQIEWHGHDGARDDAVLDNCVATQQYFFDLYLLHHVQDYYSRGAIRTDKANERITHKTKYMAEAEQLFKVLRRKGRSKECSYDLIANKMRTMHADLRKLSRHTVKSWFKGRKDLR